MLTDSFVSIVTGSEKDEIEENEIVLMQIQRSNQFSHG